MNPLLTHGLPGPFKVCIAGIGGYAAAHHSAIQEIEQLGLVVLKATCDPRWKMLENEAARFAFADRGVSVLESFEQMVAEFGDDCDLMTIATPISLHAPMHAECVRRGIACYLEKPPTLDPFELESMIEHDAKARFPSQVGFSHIVESWRQSLKRRLLDGDFGSIRSISFAGAWQRNSLYYNRAPWAGKLCLNGDLVLDSCFGNAMAHNAHNALFFGGSDGVLSWANLSRVSAELYRANPIEGADTVFSEATTTDGIRIRVAMTHASSSRRFSEEYICCQKATLRIIPNHTIEIQWKDRPMEIIDISRKGNNLVDNLRHYTQFLRGKVDRPLTTLSDSRSFVFWNALNYLAAGRIHDICVPHKSSSQSAAFGQSWVISGIDEKLQHFSRTGEFPSLSAPWGRTGGAASLADLRFLPEAIARLAGPEQSSRQAAVAMT